MIKVAGIDGCSGGWFVVIYQEAKWNHGIFSSIEELISQFPDLDYYLIDIPIGLGDEKITRTIDSRLRDLLRPKRHASVFTPPVYEALYAKDYNEAKLINQQITGKMISIQSWNIVPKIREVNEWLWKHETYHERVFEAHPELCFSGLNKMKPMLNTKSSKEGFDERFELLASSPFLGALDIKELMKFPTKSAKKDDILDALCLCLSAIIGVQQGFELLLDDNRYDYRGIAMRLIYPRLSKTAL